MGNPADMQRAPMGDHRMVRLLSLRAVSADQLEPPAHLLAADGVDDDQRLCDLSVLAFQLLEMGRVG